MLSKQQYQYLIYLSGKNLRHIPNIYRTVDLCEAAVCNYGPALKHVPKRLRNGRMCYLAMGQNIKAHKFVPKNLKSADLVLKHFKKNPRLIRLLHYSCINARMHQKAARTDWRYLRHCPGHLITYEMAKEAVKKNIAAALLLPNRLSCRIYIRELAARHFVKLLKTQNKKEIITFFPGGRNAMEFKGYTNSIIRWGFPSDKGFTAGHRI